MLRHVPILLFVGLTAATASRAQVSPHYCAADLVSSDAHDALFAFRKMREAGRMPAAAKAGTIPPTIGEQRSFNTYDDHWTSREFVVRDVTTEYYLWVEVGEWSNGHVSQSKVDALREPLLNATPQGSINPSSGVMVNNRAYFGEPPNYDGDGIVDILLYDIEESGVGGYVISTDIYEEAGPGQGNQADVLYIDSLIGTNSLAGIVAHEYTHLIHFAAGSDVLTFVTEGLAEYSMVLNAVAFRRPTYLANASEQSVPLFDWRGIAEVGGLDYQRANLFYSYIAQRIGPEATASMAQSKRKGTAGLKDGLRAFDLTLRSIVQDFHTANLLNDRSIDPAFGHELVQRQGYRTPVSTLIDGSTQLFYPRREEPATRIESGAVSYVEFSNVMDLSLALVSGTAIIALRDIIKARMLLVDFAGQTSWVDISAQTEPYSFPGTYESATLVLIHADPETARGEYFLDAEWQHVAEGTDAEADSVLPIEVSLAQNYPNPFNPTTSIQYEIAASGPVRLLVFDALGRSVATIVDKTQPAGSYEVGFHTDSLPTGLYFYVLETAAERRVRQMTLLR